MSDQELEKVLHLLPRHFDSDRHELEHGTIQKFAAASKLSRRVIRKKVFIHDDDASMRDTHMMDSSAPRREKRRTVAGKHG